MNSPDKMGSVLAEKSKVKKAFTLADLSSIIGIGSRKVGEITLAMGIKPEPVEGWGGRTRAVFSDAQVRDIVAHVLESPPVRTYKKRAQKEVDRELGIVHAIMAVRDEVAKNRVAMENLNLRAELIVIHLKRLADQAGSKVSPQVIEELVRGMRKGDGGE